MVVYKRLAFAMIAPLVLALLFSADSISAMSQAADAMCNPVIVACECGQILVKGQCQMASPAANKHNCPPGPEICQDTTNGKVTIGTCPSPNKCLGTTADGKGVDQGLSKLGEMLSQLMQKLMSGAGGGSPPSSPPPTTPTTPTTQGCAQYYQVSSPTTDPCAYYVPPVSNTLNGTSTDSGLLNGSGLSNDLLLSPDTSNTDTTPVSDILNQTPTYTTGGTDTSQTPTGNIHFGSVNIGSSTMQVLTDGNINLLPGVQGDIKLLDSGVTVVASTLDEKTNSTVAGFYGADTLPGQATGVVANLCQNRPWASNFLSFIIPPVFFDSLCLWRGYQVGTPPPPAASDDASAGVTVVHDIAPAKATVKAAATTTSNVAPKVDIWAVPASVGLGSRTSIFWSSEGVTNCTETSPDGSFSQNTLAGGASTVPLTGATTYTMSCIAPDGSHITDYVTVQISI